MASSLGGTLATSAATAGANAVVPGLGTGISVLSSILGGLGGGGSAKRAAANAARQAREIQQRAEDQARADLAPYTQGGRQASYTLSQLLGLDNFDRDTIAANLKKSNPDLFAQEASVQTRKRAPDSASYAKYGEGTQYLINGQWEDIPDTAAKYYTDEQNAAIDAEIERLKGGDNYGKLTKNFTLDDYIADPGYQFRLDEGNKALERAQSRRGNFYSGAALKEADKYNSGMASQEYGSAYDRFNNDNNTLYNRLAGISNTGLGAVNSGVASGQTVANNTSDIYGQLGSFNAAAATQNQNNQNQAISNIGNKLSNLLGGGQSSYSNIWR